MGFFSDIRAIGAIKKIKNGSRAKLSISQITGCLINLLDARRNLSAEKYNQVYELFIAFRTCNTKIEMDRDGYLQQAIEIIKRFDAIAPYEKYSGGNEIEFSFLMDDIRSENETYNHDDNNYTQREKDQYAHQLVQQSNGMIDIKSAKTFVNILLLYPVKGKSSILRNFDTFVEAIIVPKYGSIQSIIVVSFFIGVLNANGIITETELDTLKKEFIDKIIGNVFSNQ